MVGDQIKYEPGWICHPEQKKAAKNLNVQGCTRVLTGKSSRKP
jgi:hypothetical protein